MSSEYVVIVEGEIGELSLSVLKDVFALIANRAPPYKIELAFEQFGEKAEQRLARILDRHRDLLLAFEGIEERQGDLILRWNGYGYGEGFLEEVLALLSAIGLQALEGRASGDEGIYRCVLVDGEVECHYHDD